MLTARRLLTLTATGARARTIAGAGAADTAAGGGAAARGAGGGGRAGGAVVGTRAAFFVRGDDGRGCASSSPAASPGRRRSAARAASVRLWYCPPSGSVKMYE